MASFSPTHWPPPSTGPGCMAFITSNRPWSRSPRRPSAARFISLMRSGRLPRSPISAVFHCIWTARGFGQCRRVSGPQPCRGHLASRASDVLSFGLTKNGAMTAEALMVFGHPEWLEGMERRRKRGGHLLSKNALRLGPDPGHAGRQPVAGPRRPGQCPAPRNWPALSSLARTPAWSGRSKPTKYSCAPAPTAWPP